MQSAAPTAAEWRLAPRGRGRSAPQSIRICQSRSKPSFTILNSYDLPHRPHRRSDERRPELPTMGSFMLNDLQMVPNETPGAELDRLAFKLAFHALGLRCHKDGDSYDNPSARATDVNARTRCTCRIHRRICSRLAQASSSIPAWHACSRWARASASAQCMCSRPTLPQGPAASLVSEQFDRRG